MLIDTLKREIPETVFPFDISSEKLKDSVTFLIDQNIEDFVVGTSNKPKVPTFKIGDLHLPYTNTFLQMRDGGLWVIEVEDCFFLTAYPREFKQHMDKFDIVDAANHIPIVSCLKFNDDSGNIEYSIRFTPEGKRGLDTTSYTIEDVERSSNMCFLAVLQFLFILSCKNIRAVRMPGALKRKKHKKPLHSYYTLQIADRVKSAKGKAKNIWSNRVHLCMGHVKTYTAEAPLFGHYVGNVWCPPHARGNRKKGVIHKDYTLA